MSDQLFTGFKIGEIALNNRIVMAPMTRNRAPDCVANSMMAEYYGQRASAGLIISEGAQISEQGVGYPATPGIHSPKQVSSWKQVTHRVHANGGKIFCQLWHCGRISHPDFHQGERPVAPSEIQPAGEAFTYEGLKPFVTPRALSTEEIAECVAQYGRAAANAIAAGFDGVEIHAANGYLIDQFLRDGSNRRKDQYGGSIENRLRLLLEVVDRVAATIGAGRTGVRISPINGFNDMHDSSPQATFNAVADALSGKGLAYLHVVEVNMAGVAEDGFNAVELRGHFDGVYMANGGYDQQRGEASLVAGHAELISFGIPFLANPDLPERFRQNSELNSADMSTLYGGDQRGYTDYPSLEGK